MVAPWSACLPLLRRDKKARHTSGAAGDEPATEIHCVLPRVGEPAIQRTLAPEAWELPHAHLVDLLNREAPRA